MILQIVLIVILERSELIHLILYLLNMLTSPNVIILIGSVVNKNKNKYCYNIFMEKGLYKDKWMFVYYKCYIMIEFMFLKELMLIKQVHQTVWCFLTISIY